MPTWPSPRSEQLGTPNPPRNPFHTGQVFRGFPIHAFATACQVARSLYGSDRHARPPGAFTSRLPTDRLPSPLLDITTTATGLLCWRDSHPLEWQLASLHLLLHRKRLALSTPCRSPGASQMFSALAPTTDIAQ